MTIHELRIQRDGILSEARKLNARAETERRDLTNEEKDRFDKLMGDATRVVNEIRLAEAGGGDYEAWLRRSQNTVAVHLDTTPDPGNYIADDGSEVRFLTREQRLADLVPRPEEPLSLGKIIRGKVTGNWKGADSERRALSEGLDTAGGFLIPDLLAAQVIDLARNQAVVLKAGAITVPMSNANLSFARLTADPVGHWRGENVEITEDTAMAFDKVNLNARTLGCLIRTSVEMVEDCANIGSLVQASMSKALALEVDRVGLMGIGAAEEPLGIYEPGAGAQVKDMGAAAGGALNGYDEISEAYRMIMDRNGLATSIIMSPREWGYLDVLKDGEGEYNFTPPESWKALQKLVTNQVPTTQTWGSANNASFAVVGDWTNLYVGLRTQMVFEISRVAADAFSKMQVLIRGYLRGDTCFIRPQMFTVIKGIIPAS